MAAASRTALPRDSSRLPRMLLPWKQTITAHDDIQMILGVWALPTPITAPGHGTTRGHLGQSIFACLGQSTFAYLRGGRLSWNAPSQLRL